MNRFIVTKKDESSTLDTTYESSNNYSTSISTETDESQYEYTETDESQYEYTETDVTESELNESEYDTETETKQIKLKKINGKLNNINNEYKRLVTLPRTNVPVKKGLTKEQILKRLEGCISLNTIEDMEILNTLPLRKVWIWYMHKETKAFKMGGFLMKVAYPDYIVLVNYRNKITWSVQLKDNILFIKNTEEMERLNKAHKIKQKLYKLYNEGKLLLNDN